MKTSRELFQLVKEKFRGRHNDKSTVGKYYDRIKVPGGCAIGGLMPKEDRKSLQNKCENTRLPYAIQDILKDPVQEVVPEVEFLREYPIFALLLLQRMHDKCNTVGEFKRKVDLALVTGVATVSGLSDLYLDEELTNDDI